jgi:hypothetical protein
MPQRGQGAFKLGKGRTLLELAVQGIHGGHLLLIQEGHRRPAAIDADLPRFDAGDPHQLESG